MAVTVRIPPPLRELVGQQAEVAGAGQTVKEVLADLERQYPGLRERIYDDSGKLRRFVNVYVNDEDIRFLQSEDTPLQEGDLVSIIPAIAGG